MTGRTRYDDTVPGLRDLLSRQAGLARRSQLRQLGVTDKHVAAQVAAMRWTVVAPEVVSTDNGRLDLDQQRWRAALHAPTGWIGGRSALQVLGLRGYEPEGVQLLVPASARPVPLNGVVIHVTGRLDGLEPRRGTALPLTSPARAVVDGASWSPHPRLAAGLVVAAMQQRLVGADELDGQLALAGRIRHKVAIREALRGALEGAESVREMDLGPLLRRAGLRSFRRQALAPGRRHDVEVDLPDGSVLVLEVDGPTHDTPEGRWRDAERDAEVAADGKLSIHIPQYAVDSDPSGVVRRLARIRIAAERRRDSR